MHGGLQEIPKLVMTKEMEKAWSLSRIVLCGGIAAFQIDVGRWQGVEREDSACM